LLVEDGWRGRQPIVIRLELRREDDSLTGRASGGAGAAREFVGWMGLVAAIDALVQGSSPAAAADSPNGRAGGAAS
jgi:hypothetical protein